MALQQTLILVKPDGVARGLVGEVIKRLEQRGLKIVALKLVRVDMDHAKQHYTDDIIQRHGEEIRNQLVEFVTEGPVVAMVIEGVAAIENVRKLAGITESKSAAPGTIRGDFSHVDYGHSDENKKAIRNVVHTSANEEEAKHEIALWFSIDEIFEYKRADESHVF